MFMNTTGPMPLMVSDAAPEWPPIPSTLNIRTEELDQGTIKQELTESLRVQMAEHFFQDHLRFQYQLRLQQYALALASGSPLTLDDTNNLINNINNINNMSHLNFNQPNQPNPWTPIGPNTVVSSHYQPQPEPGNFVMSESDHQSQQPPWTNAEASPFAVPTPQGLPSGSGHAGRAFRPSPRVSRERGPGPSRSATRHVPAAHFHPAVAQREPLRLPATTADDNVGSHRSNHSSSSNSTASAPFAAAADWQNNAFHGGQNFGPFHGLPINNDFSGGGGGLAQFNAATTANNNNDDDAGLYGGAGFSRADAVAAAAGSAMSMDMMDMSGVDPQDPDRPHHQHGRGESVTSPGCWSNTSGGANMPTPGMPTISADSPPYAAAGPADGPTVSPKQLRIAPSPTIAAASSSESLRNTLLAAAAAEGAAFASTSHAQPWPLGSSTYAGEAAVFGAQAAAAAAAPRAAAAAAPKKTSAGRKQLPDKAPSRYLSAVPGTGSHGQHRSHGQHGSLAGEPSPPPSSSKQPKQLKQATKTSKSSRPASASRLHRQRSPYRSIGPAQAATRPVQQAPPQAQVPGAPGPGVVVGGALTDRHARDAFLVRMKDEGMTYKEIKAKGNFSEAESTLRGRYRTLTKTKESRVRKPEWKERDIELLEEAVHKLTTAGDIAAGKIPWKKVAQYIVKNGGSYLFGNNTCKRRWEVLNSDED